MKQIVLKVSKYNELKPEEIQKVLDLGGRIIRDNAKISAGKSLRYYTEHHIDVLTTDEIELNNVRIPLSLGKEEYYDCELIINVK